MRAEAQKTPEAAGTDSAVAFINTLTSVSVGALVFSIGLTSNGAEFGWLARGVLLFSWVAYFLSVVFGLLLQATVPIHIKDGISIFTSDVFNGLAKAQQLSIGAATLAMAAVLIGQLLEKPVAAAMQIPSAAGAIARLNACGLSNTSGTVQHVEFLASANALDPGKGVWHLTLARAKPAALTEAFVEAGSGNVTTSPPLTLAPACRTH